MGIENKKEVSIKFSLKHVDKDILISIKKNDYRFICIKGLGMTIPRDINIENKIVKQYGYKCICIDDSNATIENIKIVKKIYNYGEKYNLLLLNHLIGSTKVLR